MNSDDISKSILESLGFSIIKLPEPHNRKEADFLGCFGGDRFLIEAKIKTDPDEIIKEKEDVLSKGRIFIAEDDLGRDETISTVIREGSHQLRVSAKVHDHDYKVLFLLSTDINTRTKADKIIDTLYGRTQIVESGKSTLKPCYFFRHGDLYRRKADIDAVIVGYEDVQAAHQLILCFNPYSDKYDALKISTLSSAFGSAIVDPINEEKNGRAYIPDSNVPRAKSNESYLTPFYNPMLHHLQDKYKTGILLNVDFSSPEFTVRRCGNEL